MHTLNISKRERYILIAVVAVVISAILYNFIFEPALKKWSTLNKEILVKRTKIKKELKLLENRNTIIKEYNAYAYTAKNITKILNYIENLSNSLGITVANIKPQPVVEKGLYEEYIIEVQIEGEFADINKFTAELIKSPVFISVKKFDFRVAAPNSSRFKGTLILSKIII